MLSSLLSSKIVLIVATLLGMALCTTGIGSVAARGAWLSPFAIAGYFFGAAILLVVAAAVFNIRLPLIDSTQAAFIALVVLVGVKIALTQLHRITG